MGEGANRNIYVRQRDLPVWDRAAAWAERNDRSLAWVISRALEEWLERHGGEQ